MRCSKITAEGQCGGYAAPGSSHCKKHTSDRDQIAAYRLSDPKLNDAVKHHTRASLTNLSEQLILLRAMIERRLNLAGDDEASQIVAYNFVATQLASLTKMTESFMRLARESGELMSREEVEDFVDRVIVIISEEISHLPGHESVVDRIAERINE